MEAPDQSFLGFGDKHVLVTGASGGIGISVSKLYAAHGPGGGLPSINSFKAPLWSNRFLEQGAKVTMHYNTQNDSLHQITAAFPERSNCIKADVRNEQEVPTWPFHCALFSALNAHSS